MNVYPRGYYGCYEHPFDVVGLFLGDGNRIGLFWLAT